MQLDYSYGATQNNGNVITQTITVPTVGSNNGFVAVQTYNYDPLNRLKDATEMSTPNGGSASQSWKQEFSYDRYGNRNFVTGSGHTDTLGSCTTMCNPSFNTSNNRINSTGYSFDNAGNTTADPSGQVFTYDGENKQVLVTNSSGTVGQYWYDGDGKRVKKHVPGTGETTVFVYDAAGKEIAEYSTVVASSTEAKVNYLTADHLGSPRINTDQNGAVTARHDYMPFGEEIGNIGGRNNGGDAIRKQFTGYERDSETGLNFAESRMMSSSVGRFVSPDRYSVILEKQKEQDEDKRSAMFVGFLSNPQRWNVYIYVLNNPMAFTDPNGENPQTINIFLGPVTEDGLGQWEKFAEEARNRGFTVNIYLVDGNGGMPAATAAEFLASLKAKDTVTIFAGHSQYYTAPNGTEVHFGIELNGATVANGAAAKGGHAVTADEVDIQNDIVAVFSCDFGPAFRNLTSSNRATFVWIAQGEDRGTEIGSVYRAALAFARSVAEPSRGFLTKDSDLRRDVRRAQDGLDEIKYPQNAGDTVRSRTLLPRKGN